MKSITGVEFNNPSICVKGTNFGCLCEKCKVIDFEAQKRLDAFFEKLN